MCAHTHTHNPPMWGTASGRKVPTSCSKSHFMPTFKTWLNYFHIHVSTWPWVHIWHSSMYTDQITTSVVLMTLNDATGDNTLVYRKTLKDFQTVQQTYSQTDTSNHQVRLIHSYHTLGMFARLQPSRIFFHQGRCISSA